MSAAPASSALPSNHAGTDTAASYQALKAFVALTEQRVHRYLQGRLDRDEQIDHLHHVADRARWMYYGELQRRRPSTSISITEHEDHLLEACVYSHDIGKWVPREDLRQILPGTEEKLIPFFKELKFTRHQIELFVLGVNQRFALEKDGYVPEYDSAHHLVSAYMLVADESFGFHQLEAVDQTRLINMVVGHQFQSYFKESLINIRSLRQREGRSSPVTTGMLEDFTDPNRLYGDVLACAFHDGDISDLLFVGSLERRLNREPIFHTGGLVKILMINFTNCIYQATNAPKNLNECLSSCYNTVGAVFNELITPTARIKGKRWQREARRFLATLRHKSVAGKIQALLNDASQPPEARLLQLRMFVRLHAGEFLSHQNASPQPDAPEENAH